MELQIGHEAPQFSLYNTEKNKINLSDFKGKNVLLLFFPFAFTGVCTNELCSVRDSLAEYNKLSTEVLAISVDSIFTLQKFKDDQKLNFNLLSDFNKEVSSHYGVLYETFPAFELKGVSKRAAFVIGTDGKIKYTEVCPTPGDIPNFSLIQEALKA
ncbi:MAG: redoxin domain-containing protein [Alphaproteobacteria bacterium]|nr:redoxin domain-containing protein [Alphaproteobacteria bacterium]